MNQVAKYGMFHASATQNRSAIIGNVITKADRVIASH